ncbi:MAG: DNA repair ATPase [Bacteroidales bacterium]|jgi:predicted ATPase|nr:DNA repair ATPase [Bacteroidales bacterium]
MQDTNQPAETLDAGTYEIIRKRLFAQRDDLSQRLGRLNDARKEVFRAIDFTLLANQRINTENNCVSRGIMAFGKLCIFGYNVHFGLRSDIQLSDVFSIYRFEDHQFIPQSLDLIDDEQFVNDYKNLYRYYRDSIFSRFRRTENYLYMIFQTGKNVDDLKAFKWLIKGDRLIYRDDRSIHEVKRAEQHEFKWTKTTLEDRRLGVYPHVSVLDRVFIEAVGGDITFKIEDNTQTGKGIYAEKVENKDQQLDDAEYYYADLGNLILVRIKPYQESYRAFVFNTRTREVHNIPMLNDAGILLPDHHGVIFPNGYYLQNGEYKIFDNDLSNLEFFRKMTSPNGEDFLYIFYQHERNIYVLMSYNIIRQQVETPIICNGFTFFGDGALIYFRSEVEATRHHQVQIWQTPYQERLIENPEKCGNQLYKIGNKDIVKVMAECQEVIYLINKEDSYEGLYEDIVKKSNDIVDAYFWVSDDAAFRMSDPLKEIKKIANTAIDEFEKVQAQKKHAAQQLTITVDKVDALMFRIKHAKFDTLDSLVKLLAETRRLQGEVIELGNVKYADITRVNELKNRLAETNTILSAKTVEFLLRDEALAPYEEKTVAEKARVEEVTKVIDANRVDENCKLISSELELLIDILNSLKIEDTTQATRIIEKISLIFSSLNELRAQLKRKIDSLRNREAVAEFSAQLTLLEQSVANYLELAASLPKCDEYFAKASIQVEEMEGKFADFDEFIGKIADKRDEITKAFDGRKAQLMEQINRRSSSLEQIGLRVLKNIENKAQSFKTKEEIQSFFSSDLMIDKVRQLVDDLKSLGDVSKAENLENSLKTSREDALRVLKDRNELFVDGQQIISLGTHKFTVNRQPLDLTVVRRDNRLFYHLMGTGFFHELRSERLAAYRDYWEQETVSENAQVYRAEYLAWQTFAEKSKTKDFDPKAFITHKVEQCYSESYVKGVHDDDAVRIYQMLEAVNKELGILSFTPRIRASAQLLWYSLEDMQRDRLIKMIASASSVLKVFPESDHYKYVMERIKELFRKEDPESEKSLRFPLPSGGVFSLPCGEEGRESLIAEYLFREFSASPSFTKSEQAETLKKDFLHYLGKKDFLHRFETDIRDESFDQAERFHLTCNWLESFIDESKNCEQLRKYPEEAACLLLFDTGGEYILHRSGDQMDTDGLKGNHAVIVNGFYAQDYHRFVDRMTYFTETCVPAYNEFIHLKETLVADFKKTLKLNELKPRVLTSFVRNKLINEVYLPLIGANLAKQLGVAGEDKRTARMGMLLLVSPPGYGKTTLMEYLAKTMGLTFVKINGPTIGHSITSIDPSEAKTSGAREELKKINLSFEMADSVMLYLDDIQHCSPEFLQKFISLADGQRKMDGTFDGESKTYDLRGKRFCVVMAGNPYTESGEKFRIPDMLANRADVYNLGDVIGGSEDLFRLSLLENAMAENSCLQKVGSKSFADFYRLIRFVETGDETLLNLEGNHTRQDVDDFIAVARHAMQVRETVLQVNRQYIASAATKDAYRTEPPFKLQGSYRDMNKMTGLILPLMNAAEVDTLILNHYESEAQTLTSDNEANLLKLKEITGKLTDSDRNRWEAIKTIFLKNNKLAGIGQDNPMGQVIAQLAQFNEGLEGIKAALATAVSSSAPLVPPDGKFGVSNP